MDNLGGNNANMALFNRCAGGIAQRSDYGFAVVLASGYPLATTRLNA
mgnify:CR=1 FL=1